MFRKRSSPEEVQPTTPNAFKEGDSMQTLVDLAANAFADAQEVNGKFYVRIPVEDPNYMMTLASGLWLVMNDGSVGRANELVVNTLETSLGWTVDMMCGASINDPDSGDQQVFLGVTVSSVTPPITSPS